MDLTHPAASMLPAVFLLVFLGMPVAFALIAISTLFAWPIFGALTGLQLYQFIGSVSANYALAAIPLFIFMGAVLESSGIGRRAFEAMTIWFGRLPGGLAIATMAMSTLFAAGTGVVGAVEVMIGLHNTKQYRESAWTQAGDTVVTVPTEFGVLGMAVCYDVRFPELFRALRVAGADILVLPSAFTKVTGAAQCFLVAAAQVGDHANGRQTYGHALIIDGWGRILAESEQPQPGLATALVDMTSLASIRRDIPVAEHFNWSQKVIHANTKR